MCRISPEKSQTELKVHDHVTHAPKTLKKRRTTAGINIKQKSASFCNHNISIMKEETKDFKKISVVMCTYNGEKYLREQMDSILAQTYPIYEFIVCDDSSKDHTMDILQEYASRYDFIKVFQNQPNKGCNQNFHDILYMATGEYVAISYQDDIWFPEKLETLLQKMDNTPGCNLCFSDIISSATYTDQQTADYIALPYTAESMLFRDNIAGHSMLLKTTFIHSLKEWNHVSFYYDWWLAMNAALTDSIAKCEKPLSWHRIHAESVIASSGKILSGRRSHSPLMPYMAGISHFLRLRKTTSWNCFYGNILQQTSNTHHPVLHRITKLFGSRTPFGLLRLCLTCMKYRKEIYPYPHKDKGLIFMIRGFFAPFICTYYNIQFYK